MLSYLVSFLIVALLSGLWVWAVSRYGGVRFPTADLVLTVLLCSAVGALPRAGWLIATMILVTVALKVEKAEPWPETVVLAAGPMVMWFVAGMTAWVAFQG
jgi:hypothetical protein